MVSNKEELFRVDEASEYKDPMYLEFKERWGRSMEELGGPEKLMAEMKKEEEFDDPKGQNFITPDEKEKLAENEKELKASGRWSTQNGFLANVEKEDDEFSEINELTDPDFEVVLEVFSRGAA